MKLLHIRIPMATPGAIVPDEESQSVKRAALEELCALIPGLSNLKSSIPGIGTQAFGDQLYLTVTLAPASQLVLKLSPEHWRMGRVVELDHTLVDQVTVKTSIQLTQDLLADAGHGIPAALSEWLEKFEKVERRRSANRQRRELGRRYEIVIFGEPEIVSLPTFEPTQLEEESRSISLIVTGMKGKRSFEASHLTELRDDDLEPITFDPRSVWRFLRFNAARTYDAGQHLHRSMETGQRIVVSGRFVSHVVTGAAIAMEVDCVHAQSQIPATQA
jgi:hypothetical protein